MKDSQSDLVKTWERFPEIFSPEKGEVKTTDWVDLIADFLFTGNYYYYVIDIADQSLSSQHKNILKTHGIKDLPQQLQQIVDLVHPEDLDFVMRAEEAGHRYILNTGIQFIQSLKCCYCFRMRIADGSYRLFHHQSISIVVDSQYRIVKSLNIHSDIEHITSVNNHMVTIVGINGRNDFHQIPLAQKSQLAQPVVKLTFREQELLRYIAKGHSSAQIAVLMGISVHTARVHRKNLHRKMDCHSVATLLRKAVEWGLV